MQGEQIVIKDYLLSIIIMPSTEYKRFVRRKLWEAQDGKCCFCHCDTILPENLGIPLDKVSILPDNTATIEHINSRLVERRRCKKEYREGFTKMKMSCFKCNQDRMKLEHKVLNEKRKARKNKGIVYSTEKLCQQ